MIHPDPPSPLLPLALFTTPHQKRLAYQFCFLASERFCFVLVDMRAPLVGLPHTHHRRHRKGLSSPHPSSTHKSTRGRRESQTVFFLTEQTTAAAGPKLNRGDERRKKTVLFP